MVNRSFPVMVNRSLPVMVNVGLTVMVTIPLTRAGRRTPAYRPRAPVAAVLRAAPIRLAVRAVRVRVYVARHRRNNAPDSRWRCAARGILARVLGRQVLGRRLNPAYDSRPILAGIRAPLVRCERTRYRLPWSRLPCSSRRRGHARPDGFRTHATAARWRPRMGARSNGQTNGR